MRCIIALVNMSIIFARLGFGADPAEGGGALTRMCLSAPHSRKRPLPTFQKFHDTRPGALTRVSTVRCLYRSIDSVYTVTLIVYCDDDPSTARWPLTYYVCRRSNLISRCRCLSCVGG